MMSNDVGPWRGYDQRYENAEWMRQGRMADPRWQNYERYPRRLNGDWMRENAWGRESQWTRSDVDLAPTLKVIEVFAQSPHSWEDAARRAVLEASQTISGIRSIHIENMQALVDDDQLVSYRVHAKISFGLDDRRRR